MNKLYFLFTLLLCAQFAFAVPAANVTITHTQKDGTVLTLRLVGDEHMSYYVDVATGKAMRKGADGDYVEIPQAEFKARAEQASFRRAEANKRRISRLPRMQQKSSHAGGPAYVASVTPMTGTKKGLVILVNFQDEKFRIGANGDDYSGTVEAFNNQFNQEGYSENGHIGSVKDYFSAQSYGKFTVDFDVVGPVTVSQGMAYYGAPVTIGERTEHDSYPADMVYEACQLAHAAGTDFSKYDWNGNGEVDQVFVIYAGYNEARGASENTIWPHEWELHYAKNEGQSHYDKFELDGKIINIYACASELADITDIVMDGIGAACHEFSHCLGYPDLYDTDYAKNGIGVGMFYYDLMALGSYNGPGKKGEIPCGYSAYERWMAGWLTPTELDADAATITGMVPIDSPENGGNVLSDNPVLASSPSRAYIIKNGSDDDYYLLENRPKTGYYQYLAELPDYSIGCGLFITHVQYDEKAWYDNAVNADSCNQRLIFVPADGDMDVYNTYRTDFYPSLHVTSFTDVANKEVTNITRSDGLISFDYKGGHSSAPGQPELVINAQVATGSDKVFNTFGKASVRLTRSFNANAYNTLVLPFDMTAEQIASTFGSSATVYDYTGTTANDDESVTLNFQSSTTITANHPVFIYGAENVENKLIEDVFVEDRYPATWDENAVFDFVGVYAISTLCAGNVYINSQNQLVTSADDTIKLQPTHAYFQRFVAYPVVVNSFTIDGEETGIAMMAGGNVNLYNGQAYNLAGQRVSAKAMTPGIYVIGGRKVVVK